MQTFKSGLTIFCFGKLYALWSNVCFCQLKFWTSAQILIENNPVCTHYEMKETVHNFHIASCIRAMLSQHGGLSMIGSSLNFFLYNFKIKT